MRWTPPARRPRTAGLTTESLPGRVVEVTADGRTVWEWVVETHDESRVPEVIDAVRYDQSREDVRSWPCSADGEAAGRSREAAR